MDGFLNVVEASLALVGDCIPFPRLLRGSFDEEILEDANGASGCFPIIFDEDCLADFEETGCLADLALFEGCRIFAELSLTGGDFKLFFDLLEETDGRRLDADRSDAGSFIEASLMLEP